MLEEVANISLTLFHHYCHYSTKGAILAIRDSPAGSRQVLLLLELLTYCIREREKMVNKP